MKIKGYSANKKEKDYQQVEKKGQEILEEGRRHPLVKHTDRNQHWKLNGHLMLNHDRLNFRWKFTNEYPQLISSKYSVNNTWQIFKPIISEIPLFL